MNFRPSFWYVEQLCWRNFCSIPTHFEGIYEMSRIVLFFGLRKRDIFYYCSGFLSFERVGISVESQLNGTVYIISYLFCLCLFCFTSFFNYHECLILRDSGWTLVQALSIFQTICYLSEANALWVKQMFFIVRKRLMFCMCFSI